MITFPQILILSAFTGLAVYAALLISRYDVREKIAKFLLRRSDGVFFGAVLAIIALLFFASYAVSSCAAKSPVPARQMEFKPNAPR